MIESIPLAIDAHVHFRTPGSEHKEDWTTGSRAALHGGIGFVCDMPNNDPSIVSEIAFKEKVSLIDSQIRRSGYPLRYRLYFGATPYNCREIKKMRKNDLVCGVKVFMGSSTGSLLVCNDDDLRRIFETAREAGLIVAIHAEDEEMIMKRSSIYSFSRRASAHSLIRDDSVAISALSRAINISREIGNRLYVCHVSSVGEIELIKRAKRDGLPVFAEACLHHLFFTKGEYAFFGNLIKVNPPVRKRSDCRALWRALNDGTIDVLATDHAPHLLQEKKRESFSGISGTEFLLPSMLNAVNEERISLKRLVDLIHFNPIKIFNLGAISGETIVDMDWEGTVEKEELRTKCGWSPYVSLKFCGRPIKTVLDGKEYDCIFGDWGKRILG